MNFSPYAGEEYPIVTGRVNLARRFQAQMDTFSAVIERIERGCSKPLAARLTFVFFSPNIHPAIPACHSKGGAVGSSPITKLSTASPDPKKDRGLARNLNRWASPGVLERALARGRFRTGVSLSSLSLRHDGEGQLFVLYGHSAVHSLAQKLLARPLFHGCGVVVLDAGNLFDPYLISRMAQALGREPREFLSRILVSRSFTCHQTHALARKLCASFNGSISRIVLVLGCPKTFYDEEVSLGERVLLLRRTIISLKEVSQRGIKVLVTSADPPLNVPGGFTDLLVHASDRAARLELDQYGSLGISLIKGNNETVTLRR
ncbi:MAG: hypothetical protein ACE5JU_11330 [Candidatus Binatia bacterium]